MIPFAESVAAALRPHAPALAARWRERARAATPRAPRAHDPAAADDSVAIVCAVVSCLDRDARWQGEVMRLAWGSGAASHAGGLSVHHVLKDGDLLQAILLTAAEECARAGHAGDGSAADAFLVARRLQRAVGLFQQTAASSYVHALVGALRVRWRLLRHDLRDPLGTIRSALSLMEDETAAPEMRTGPRIRAMVSRNAGSLEGLIASGLDDGIAAALVAAPQEVRLRDVALAVRRSLRDAARLAECEIVVDDDLPLARVDEAAVELTLSTLLLAAVAHARPGDVLRVGRAPEGTSSARRRGVTLRVECTPGRDALDADLSLPAAIAAEYGGRVSIAADGAALDLDLPPLAGPPALRASPGVRDGERRSERHQRDDVPRAD